MDYSMFIDESFNTGEPKYDENGWNFQRQPYFLLGAYIIKDSKIDSFKEEFIKILKKYDSKLGIEVELKSKANYKFKKKLLTDMIGLIQKYKIYTYIDISNKRYKIINNLVSYCIYPYFIYGMKEDPIIRDKCRNASNYIYNNLNDNILGEYIKICNKDEDIVELNKFLVLLKNSLNDNDLKHRIGEVIRFISKNYNKNLTLKHIYPLKDYNNKGSIMSFLPNLDAYNHITATINNLYLKKNDRVKIYHDNQVQFSKCIEKWTDINKMDKYNSIQGIEFLDSKDEILIQFIDYITGTIRKCFCDVMSGSTKKENRELIKILKPLLQNNCNVVSTKSEQKKFFDAVGVKHIMKTPIPISIKY